MMCWISFIHSYTFPAYESTVCWMQFASEHISSINGIYEPTTTNSWHIGSSENKYYSSVGGISFFTLFPTFYNLVNCLSYQTCSTRFGEVRKRRAKESMGIQNHKQSISFCDGVISIESSTFRFNCSFNEFISTENWWLSQEDTIAICYSSAWMTAYNTIRRSNSEWNRVGYSIETVITCCAKE